MSGAEVSGEAIAQGIIEYGLYDYLRDLTNDSAKLTKVSRQTSSFLSIKDIEKISQNLGQSENPDMNNFIKEIEKFGIKIPKSEKEIDEMLKG